MALKVLLRTRAGEDLTSINLPDGTTTYPEVILGKDQTYILRRVMPDKRSAVYFEARTFKLPGGPPPKKEKDN
jgi:hypothetical protein